MKKFLVLFSCSFMFFTVSFAQAKKPVPSKEEQSIELNISSDDEIDYAEDVLLAVLTLSRGSKYPLVLDSPEGYLLTPDSKDPEKASVVCRNNANNITSVVLDAAYITVTVTYKDQTPTLQEVKDFIKKASAAALKKFAIKQ